MLRVSCLLLFLLTHEPASSLQFAVRDTLKMDREECEMRFLKENLFLIAGKLYIPKAEAVAQQARLWPNPHFTLDQINLWATPGQTGGQEVVPPLFGDFGRNRQFGAEIEQLILTGRKRSKLVAVEQVNVEKAARYFEELLRNLKIDFRKTLTQLQYLQRTGWIYENQLDAVTRLLRAYERQVNEGYIPRSELVRLRALQLEIARNINSLELEKNSVQNELRLWMRVSPESYLIVTDEDFLRIPEALPALPEIMETARQNRPDLDAALLEETRALRQIDYEKAKRTPDITLKGAYDRNGNTMLNFFGIGASLSLPLFDRNQGNIKHAQLEAQQAQTLLAHQNEKVESEVVLAYQNLTGTLDFFSKIEDGYEDSLDELLQAYTRNLINRNVSLLEFLDFTDAYLKNKTILLGALKSVNDKIEELNYAAGTDVFQAF